MRRNNDHFTALNENEMALQKKRALRHNLIECLSTAGMLQKRKFTDAISNEYYHGLFVTMFCDLFCQKKSVAEIVVFCYSSSMYDSMKSKYVKRQIDQLFLH